VLIPEETEVVLFQEEEVGIESSLSLLAWAEAKTEVEEEEEEVEGEEEDEPIHLGLFWVEEEVEDGVEESGDEE
jgi:hypothetical protein